MPPEFTSDLFTREGHNRRVSPEELTTDHRLGIVYVINKNDSVWIPTLRPCLWVKFHNNGEETSLNFPRPKISKKTGRLLYAYYEVPVTNQAPTTIGSYRVQITKRQNGNESDDLTHLEIHFLPLGHYSHSSRIPPVEKGHFRLDVFSTRFFWSFLSSVELIL